MQTEKLTLAQLSGYLAYGLRMKVPYHGKIKGAYYRNGILSCQNIAYAIDWKPLVIPLDHLTEAQWIEVFKAGSDRLGKFETFRHSDKLAAAVLDFDRTECWYSFKNMQFKTDPIAFNQLAAFAKLHELHADLHGLIEKGLAINKLDYEL